MGNKMLYRTDFEKTIEAMVWLANNDPGIDIYHIAKILYYAEKTHLNRYGRPIIGATYIRMDYGQVPSQVRDIIIKNVWTVEPNYLKRFTEAIEINKDPYDRLNALRDADMGYFSDTDVECLKESLSKYGKLSFDQLKDICHDEKTWIETEQNEPIDYLLMVDEENEYKEEIIEDIRATSQYMRF
jgi:uncharacterized phage-associated protein